MLSLTGTSKSTGRIMSRLGSTNQPGKARRRAAWQKKPVNVFPRLTAGPLRPIVHGQTFKYNMKELATAIPKKLARTIGIAVDHRRRNLSLEGLQANVQRLKTYEAKLAVFPRCASKFKAGDSAPEELANATQVQGPHMPIVREKPYKRHLKIKRRNIKGGKVERINVEGRKQIFVVLDLLVGADELEREKILLCCC
ncbi:hypothetical protein FNV43_RR23793 [Rhamnella rubrinervis]|uniref:60S ribosomal protein L13 n=1 Tax=Rhamnella rubrinervis TaxID=2594499 RepID=A0A8K0DPY9_9ROSA|nr:hypothetical protein FNV43_RR23793 [Rhamnella rubrinervis]